LRVCTRNPSPPAPSPPRGEGDFCVWVRRITRSVVFILLTFLLPTLHPAHAQTPADDLLRRVVDEVIVPGYANLVASAEAQQAQWRAFCPAPSSAGLASLRDSYHRTADAWSSIELIHYGPIAEDFRGERLSFWPERKNAVEKALKAALGKADNASLAPETFRKGSAGVQGLPALERLLFSEGADETEFIGSPEAEFRCRLGSAIAANILAIAHEVQAGWADGDDAIAKRLAAPEIAGGLKAALATDLLGAYVLIKDKKLDPAMGKDPADVRPKMAEGWRSGRSLRAIQLNLEATGAILRILADGMPKKDSTALRNNDTALRVAKRLTGDLGALAAGPQRRDLILLRDAADAAGKRAFEEVPLVLGVTVGFNSLDGD
jgi:predicted lipoprotein